MHDNSVLQIFNSVPNAASLLAGLRVCHEYRVLHSCCHAAKCARVSCLAGEAAGRERELLLPSALLF